MYIIPSRHLSCSSIHLRKRLAAVFLKPIYQYMVSTAWGDAVVLISSSWVFPEYNMLQHVA